MGKGHAHAIGFLLDAMNLQGVAGTVAGDDTLFIAVTSPEALAPLVKALRKSFTPMD